MFSWRRKTQSSSPTTTPATDPAPGAHVEHRDQAPGWDAIDRACEALYPGQEPRHVGFPPPPPMSTNLNGCSAYDAGDHWHYVTYGLSALFEPEPDDDPRWSGAGMELTLRVAKADGAQGAPVWPFLVLNNLGRYARGTLVSPGDRIDVGGPVTGHPGVEGAPETGLTAYAAALDAHLGTIDTPHGQVEFVQLVGVTAAELGAMIASTTPAVLDGLREDNPLLVTDPARA